ncbi:MAG: acetyl-coenzyme A synthetase, partial [Sinobacteraceae bacterium]|nr:acetyl-coenzyme A synthetase [Nevskiaceae bacterium]MBV9316997.1 acetyl-coenzyme A synthetase [Gammaproteobacteria bacterium]
MADKNIKSVLLEERTFPPPREFTARARIKPADAENLRRRAREDHVGFWADLAAAELTWQKPFTNAFDDSDAPNYRWFSDGRLN